MNEFLIFLSLFFLRIMVPIGTMFGLCVLFGDCAKKIKERKLHHRILENRS